MVEAEPTGVQPHPTSLFVYASFIFNCTLFLRETTCQSSVSGRFLSCLPRSYETLTDPLLGLKTCTLAKGAPAGVDVASSVPVCLPTGKSFYLQVDTSGRASRRSFISIPVIEVCAAEGQRRMRASSVRHSCCTAPCDIAPCISSRGGAGCTSSMVPSGGMNEGRAHRSGRALCTSGGRLQNFHRKSAHNFRKQILKSHVVKSFRR